MDAIRLLSAPVDSPSTLDGSSQPTSLVHVARFPPAAQRSDTAYPNHNYVWTVSVGDNGSFNFYSAPRQNYGNGASVQSQDSFSSQDSTSVWAVPQSQSVAAQYALYATMTGQDRGQYVDVYA